MTIILPVDLHPPITLFDRYGFWLSILLAGHPEALPWTAVAFMGLHTVKEPDGQLVLQAQTSCSWNLDKEKILSVQSLELTVQTLRRMPFTMLPIAKELLDHGHYINVALDAYHLSSTADYYHNHQKCHRLLYGYDDEYRCFHVLGGTSEAPYQAFTMPFEELHQGLTQSELGVHILDIYQVYPGASFTVKAQDCVHNLNQYLTTGLPSVCRWLTDAGSRTHNGLLAHQDIRSWWALREHASLTEQVLCYLDQSGVIRDTAAADAYRTLVINPLADKEGEIPLTTLSEALTQEQRILSHTLHALDPRHYEEM